MKSFDNTAEDRNWDNISPEGKKMLEQARETIAELNSVVNEGYTHDIPPDEALATVWVSLLLSAQTRADTAAASLNKALEDIRTAHIVSKAISDIDEDKEANDRRISEAKLLQSFMAPALTQLSFALKQHNAYVKDEIKRRIDEANQAGAKKNVH